MKKSEKNVFLAYVPFTGLGLYGGFRGNRWLRNRITVFKQFVVPSLLNQTDQDFVLWIGWRPEEKNNKYVQELRQWLNDLPPQPTNHPNKTSRFKVVFTYGGLCFWDDKYSDKEAWDRLAMSLHRSTVELLDVIGEADSVTMLIQPSDDLYNMHTVRRMKDVFEADSSIQAVSYQLGYHTNYTNGLLSLYNPTTNPPFFAYKIFRKVFLDPLAHMNYTGPYKSHEYIGDKMKLWKLPGRGYMVGSHTENISTHANHPFVQPAGLDHAECVKVLREFGIADSPLLVLPKSWRKDLMRKLPHGWQRRLRYVFGEKLFNRIYQIIRN